MIIDGGDTYTDAFPGNQFGPWKKHFAWQSVCINDTSYWLTTVYRRQRIVAGVDWGYEYGTIFDVMKETNNE